MNLALFNRPSNHIWYNHILHVNLTLKTAASNVASRSIFTRFSAGVLTPLNVCPNNWPVECISERFRGVEWNFPTCCGDIDGKRVRFALKLHRVTWVVRGFQLPFFLFFSFFPFRSVYVSSPMKTFGALRSSVSYNTSKACLRFPFRGRHRPSNMFSYLLFSVTMQSTLVAIELLVTNVHTYHGVTQGSLV